MEAEECEKWGRPRSISCSSASVYYTGCKLKNKKNGGEPGNEAKASAEPKVKLNRKHTLPQVV